MSDPDWPLWEVFVRSRRGLSPRARRLAARARRRDGAAQRPRRLHPPQRGRLALGGPRRRDRRRPAPTSGTRSSTPPATRSTGTRRSTTSPRGSSTCDGRSALRRTSSASPTTPWSPRSGWAGGSAARRSSRRTSRWPTSASTSSARRAPCSPTPARSRARVAPRTTSPTWRDDRDFRNVQLVERAEDRLRRRDGAAAGVRDVPVRAVRRACSAARDPTLAGDRRQGGQGGRLPRRPRPPLGAPARRRHRRVARRMQRALDAEWPYVEELFAPVDPGLLEAGRVADPARLRAARPGPARDRARRGDPGRARGDARAAAVAVAGLHTEELGYLLAEMQHLAPLAPGGDAGDLRRRSTPRRAGRLGAGRRRCPTPSSRSSPSRTSASCAT